MLVRFYVENFLSFAGKTEFSMIPGKNLPHDDQLVGDGEVNLLRGAIVYGANASGKSNLVKAMAAARRMITSPRPKGKGFPDQRFRLSSRYANEPTHFEFEIQVGDVLYSYGFTFNPNRIVEEWLYALENGNERLIYERNADDLKLNEARIRNQQTIDRLKFAFEDLLQNQLFLTMVNSRNTKNLKGASVLEEVYNWFDEKLVVIFPESRFGQWQSIEEDEEFRTLMRRMLSAFDTGIKDVVLDERRRDELQESDIPAQLLEEIEKEATDGTIMVTGPQYHSFLIDKSENGLRIRELCTRHQTEEGEVSFRIVDESDGTKRLTDLIPMLASIGPADRTFLIDEIDRSLHTELSHQLIHLFLHRRDGNQSQLIATTHDTGLLDLKLLRKDEIWFVQKRKDGSSELYSLHEFKPRKDLNIRRAYLDGRFGAVPVIQNLTSEAAFQEQE